MIHANTYANIVIKMNARKLKESEQISKTGLSGKALKLSDCYTNRKKLRIA